MVWVLIRWTSLRGYPKQLKAQSEISRQECGTCAFASEEQGPRPCGNCAVKNSYGLKHCAFCQRHNTMPEKS